MENTTTSQGIETSNEFDKLLESITNSSATSDEKLLILNALTSYIVSR